MAKLICQSGPSAGHEYPLNKDLVVMGRQSSCDVQIQDTMSSRAHCHVRRDGKLFTLVDLGSRNGTHLNGKKVTERQLAFGDRIRVGEVEYLLVKESGDIELKDLLSKYEIQEKLGEGGMGIVYKATQRSMARIVALKILSPKYATKSRFVDQFIREARAAGQLNHPNIIQVHDVGTENGIHYFSMEFVDGPTCMQLLRSNGAFPVPEALEIARQTAKALEYAHGQRLIHQDIKPDNIMIGANNAVKLADLGISKTFDEIEADDTPKRVMGTPHYMAPEAALGKKIDFRVDIYSLGATIYHMLTGKTPFTGNSATEVLKAAVMDPVPAIQDINGDVPDDVCALVERLMAKKADDRYASITEIAEEIKRLQSGLKLGTDRIASSETMILQRLSKGQKPGAKPGELPGPTNAPTPAGTTGGAGHRSEPFASRTTGHHAPRTDPVAARLRLLFLFCLAAVAVFAVVLMLPSRPGQRDALPPGPAPAPGPVATPDPGLAPPAPAGGGAAADQAVRDQAARISALETQLKTQGAKADLDALLTALQDITEEPLLPANRARATQLSQRLKSALDQQRSALKDQSLAALQVETRRRCEERNFELALARIAAFPDRTDPVVEKRLGTLRDEVVRERDTYLGDLRLRIQTFVTQKNAARLKELRDQLPEAMLGSPLEQEIVDALTVIDKENAERYQAILADAAKELVKWNFREVEDRHRNQRAVMGDSPSGRQFDTYLESARKLGEMTLAMDAVLRTSDRRPRYRGVIQTLTNPDLDGADKSGLHCQLQDGAQLIIPWRDIDTATLGEIVTLVLKDQGAQYRASLDLLASARTLVAAPK